MEIKINKDIKKYEQKHIIGLNMRQLIWSIAAVVLIVLTYIAMIEAASKLRILAMVGVGTPCILIGFVNWHGMKIEKLLPTVIKNELLTPVRLVFKPKNIYYESYKRNTRNEKEKNNVRNRFKKKNGKSSV